MLEIEELSMFILEEDFKLNIDLIKQANLAGLNVYKSAYKNTLLTAIESKYPTIKKIVAENFKYLCLKYIKQNKSFDNNLDNYANDFSFFIQDFKELNSLPFLKYLAEIDLFLFYKIEDSKIELPQGSLKSWNAINKENYSNLDFNENKRELITLKRNKNSFYLHSLKIKA